ncbi:MAG: ABC transporter ATP-binding protein [Puniceicoccales bacterium]|nr:ABC transporter ATP-binding protein [Puniceicoccales bacterium]
MEKKYYGIVILSVQDLSIAFVQRDGSSLPVVQNVSFHMDHGETFALVGASGSGKSLTALSLGRLLPSHALCEGQIHFCGEEIFSIGEARMRAIRGSSIAHIFQEAMCCFNPLLTVGYQLRESIRSHEVKCGRKEVHRKAVQILHRLDFSDAERILRCYPHELSGGMLQRIAIAMAICNCPKLLIADEPTASLDCTSQRTVLELLQDLQQSDGFSLLLITHNLHIALRLADRVAVMCDGKLMEIGNGEQLLQCHDANQFITSREGILHG